MYFIGVFCLALCSISFGQVVDNGAQKITAIGIIEKDVTLPCDIPNLSSYTRVLWKDYVNNESKDRIVIYDGSALNSAHRRVADYQVNADFSLTITGVKRGDAGEYFCIAVKEDGTEVEQPYQLDLVQVPLCEGETDLDEDDREIYTCESIFSGQLPNLTYQLGGEEMRADEKTEIGIAKKQLELVARPEYNGQVLRCSLSKENFKENCDLMLHVQYKVRDVSLTPVTTSVRVGEKVMCSAKGNPTPTIEMTGVDSDMLVQEDGMVYFQVPQEWHQMQETKTISCTARNQYKGQEYVVSADTSSYTVLEAKTTEKPSDGKPPAAKAGGNSIAIAVGVIIGVLVLVIIIIAVVCVARRSSRNKEYKSAPSGEPESAREKA